VVRATSHSYRVQVDRHIRDRPLRSSAPSNGGVTPLLELLARPIGLNGN
jgi:hypothetical protein